MAVMAPEPWHTALMGLSAPDGDLCASVPHLSGPSRRCPADPDSALLCILSFVTSPQKSVPASPCSFCIFFSHLQTVTDLE